MFIFTRHDCQVSTPNVSTLVCYVRVLVQSIWESTLHWSVGDWDRMGKYLTLIGLRLRSCKRGFTTCYVGAITWSWSVFETSWVGILAPRWEATLWFLGHFKTGWFKPARGLCNIRAVIVLMIVLELLSVLAGVGSDNLFPPPSLPFF